MSMRIATAAWADPVEVKQRYAYGDGKIWLGRSADEEQAPIGYSDDRHVCLVGGSRGGKGTTAVIPVLTTWPGSICIVDPKGENATITAARRGRGSQYSEGMGQTVKVLDPFRSAQVSEEATGSFNPLDALDPENEETVDEAARIADAIVVIHEGGTNDPFWDESARALVKGLILHVLTAPQYEGRRNLVTLRKLITRGDWESVETLRDAGEKEIPPAHGLLWTGLVNNPAFDGLIAATGDGFTNMLLNSPKQYESVLQVANRNTEFIDSPAMQRVLEISDFNLSDLKTRPEGLSLYLCLPQRYMSTHYRWVRMMIALTVMEMEKVRGRPATGYPALMVLDEFAGLKRMEVIENAVAQIAGYGVKMLFVLQSLEQLKAVYKDNWETFLANSGLKIFFNLEDYFSRDYVSKLVGETEVIRELRSESDSDSISKSSSHSSSRSQSQSTSSSTSRSQSESLSRSSSRGQSENSGRSSSRGRSQSEGTNSSHSSGRSWGTNDSTSKSWTNSWSTNWGPGDFWGRKETGWSSGRSVSQSESRGSSKGWNEGQSEGVSQGTSLSQTDGTSQSYGNSYNETNGTTTGTSFSTTEGRTYGTSTSETEGATYGTSRSRTAGTSESIQKRALVTPDEIGQVFARIDDRERSAYPGLALVVISGARPLAIRRVNYYEDNQFVGLFDPHPDHPFVKPETPDPPPVFTVHNDYLCWLREKLRLLTGNTGIVTWHVVAGQSVAQYDSILHIAHEELCETEITLAAPRVGTVLQLQKDAEELPSGRALFSISFNEDLEDWDPYLRLYMRIGHLEDKKKTSAQRDFINGATVAALMMTLTMVGATGVFGSQGREFFLLFGIVAIGVFVWAWRRKNSLAGYDREIDAYRDKFDIDLFRDSRQGKTKAISV